MLLFLKNTHSLCRINWHSQLCKKAQKISSRKVHDLAKKDKLLSNKFLSTFCNEFLPHIILFLG